MVVGGPGFPEQLAVVVKDCCVQVERKRQEPFALQSLPHSPQFWSSVRSVQVPLQHVASQHEPPQHVPSPH